MDYLIEMIATNVVKITIGDNAYPITFIPVIIEHNSYIENDADITVVPSVVPVSNTYTLDGITGTEYLITLGEDGVYKFYITENDIDYLHFLIITTEIDNYFQTNLPLLISSTPLQDDDSNVEYYNFNVISMLTINFFGETNQNVFLNYEDITSGILYEGSIYQCNDRGDGSYNWQNSLGEDLLMDMRGNIIDSVQPLVNDAYYKCIKTGTPSEWGTGTLTELTLYSDYFDTWIKNVVNSIYRYNIYNQTNIDT